MRLSRATVLPLVLVIGRRRGAGALDNYLGKHVRLDPHGDKASSVARFLAQRGMTGRLRYLVGSAGQLAPVWKKWNVGSQQDGSNPELVAHTALVYGVSGSGKPMTIYPANFKPRDIVHDVPKLVAS